MKKASFVCCFCLAAFAGRSFADDPIVITTDQQTLLVAESREQALAARRALAELDQHKSFKSIQEGLWVYMRRWKDLPVPGVAKDAFDACGSTTTAMLAYVADRSGRFNTVRDDQNSWRDVRTTFALCGAILDQPRDTLLKAATGNPAVSVE